MVCLLSGAYEPVIHEATDYVVRISYVELAVKNNRSFKPFLSKTQIEKNPHQVFDKYTA
jgi:hypothetical protein